MKQYIFCLLLLGFFAPALPVQAKEYVFDLYYRRNTSVLDTNYRTNKTVMQDLKYLIHNTKVDSVGVTSFASPEGFENKSLASKRSYNSESFVLWLQSQVFPIKIGEEFCVATWASLVPVIEVDANVPYRKELLQLVTSGKSEQAISQQVIKLGAGKLFKYLDIHSLPALRKSIVTVYSAEK